MSEKEIKKLGKGAALFQSQWDLLNWCQNHCLDGRASMLFPRSSDSEAKFVKLTAEAIDAPEDSDSEGDY